MQHKILWELKKDDKRALFLVYMLMKNSIDY